MKYLDEMAAAMNLIPEARWDKIIDLDIDGNGKGWIATAYGWISRHTPGDVLANLDLDRSHDYIQLDFWLIDGAFQTAMTTSDVKLSAEYAERLNNASEEVDGLHVEDQSVREVFGDRVGRAT